MLDLRFESSRPRNEEERILPLINVVFLLLIYVMVAGRLAAVDPFLTVPPRSASEGTTQMNEVVVYVGADGRIALDDAVLNGAELQRAIARHGGLRTVRLKADGSAPAIRVVAVTNLLGAAGVEKINLLTLPEGR